MGHLLGLAILLAFFATISHGLIEDFVQRTGTRFVITREDECENFYFTGTNNYYLMLRASDDLGRCEVVEVLDKAQELGINVIRTWGFSEGPLEWRSLQPAPGEYDENTWRGMDFVLDEASKRGIRMLIAFGNYWQHFGGTDQYNRWAWQAGNGTCNGKFECRDEFFTNPYTRQMYKNHIQTMISRKNSINGRVYRDDPTIFGWNLMNEPRSYSDLYTVTRETTSGLVYNISYNSGDALQDWIEDMAGFVKTIDPVHLLTVGEEGFFGPSTPLYLFANPGPWATLEGVDFVRNHKAKGIDFATMHVYVDQWLCTEEGKDREGQMGFFKEWVDVHQQAAEEDLQMPVVLEEFGGKIADGKRYDIYKEAFDNQHISQKRGGSFGGVLFWILYHSHYFPLDKFGGGYGHYVPAPSKEYEEVEMMLRSHTVRTKELNAEQISSDVCYFEPPVPAGDGCQSLDVSLHVGGMPWVCLPGESGDVGFCSQKTQAATLYQNPPDEWKGTFKGLDAPFNTIEVVVLGEIKNTGKKPVDLEGGHIIVPFSRGVHTKIEGEWTRIEDPNDRFVLHCWTMSQFSNGATWSEHGDLCDNGVKLSFTDHSWPKGTKADRGLKIEFTKSVVLQPGDTLHGHGDEGNIMISITDNKCQDAEREECEERLDVSSMQAWARGDDVTLNYYNVPAAMSCPESPSPPRPPKKKPECDHPWRACPLEKAMEPLDVKTLFSKGQAYSRNQARSIEGLASNGAQYFVSGEVWLSGASSKVSRGQKKNLNGGELWDAGDVLVDPTDAPNPGEERSDHISKGVQATMILQYYVDDIRMRQVVGTSDTPDDEWTRVRGVVELPAGANQVEIYVEVPLRDVSVDMRNIEVKQPSLLTMEEGEKYDPCQIDPELGPDAVYVFEPEESMTVDVHLCSRGYGQGLRIYKDGSEQVRTDNECSRSDDVNGFEMSAGSKYTFVVDGYHGYPYGSFRGGRGIQIKRKDGAPFEGFDFAPTSKARDEFIRAEGVTFYKGCEPYYYVGANTWNLMDSARHESNWWAVDERLDEMKSQGLTVGRTWAFSLGTGDHEEGRKERLHLAPGEYDENLFRALDYVLDAAARRDMKLLLALEDYWLSIDRYLDWSEAAGSRTDFYTEWDIRQFYKEHVKTIVNRKNTINGLIYREDPTILAWNLMNEPRCTGCGWAISAWVEEMSLYMKAIDPNHMVTIGEEGFYSSTCERVWLNPGAGTRRTGIGSSPWALQEGQDFLANHRSDNIDFATVHVWPDNWISFADYSPYHSNENFDYKFDGDVWKEKLEYQNLWIAAHIEDAKKLGKPVIVEEFGKAIPADKLYEQEGPRALRDGESTAGDLAIRNAFFKGVYDLVEESASSGGPALGSNFWVLYRESCGECYRDPYIVVKSHNSTMELIRDHSWNMKGATEGRPMTCPAEDVFTWDEGGELFDGEKLKKPKRKGSKKKQQSPVEDEMSSDESHAENGSTETEKPQESEWQPEQPEKPQPQAQEESEWQPEQPSEQGEGQPGEDAQSESADIAEQDESHAENGSTEHEKQKEESEWQPEQPGKPQAEAEWQPEQTSEGQPSEDAQSGGAEVQKQDDSSNTPDVQSEQFSEANTGNEAPEENNESSFDVQSEQISSPDVQQIKESENQSEQTAEQFEEEKTTDDQVFQPSSDIPSRPRNRKQAIGRLRFF